MFTMNRTNIILGVVLTCLTNGHYATPGLPAEIPTPRACQLAWQEAEFGVLVCYELHTFNPGRYRQGRTRITPIEDANQFDPTRLDTDQWIKAAKDAGATFAILTASHESGFRLWQSDVNPYCLKAVQWGDGKRDLVEEFVGSCRKYDIQYIFLGHLENRMYDSPLNRLQSREHLEEVFASSRGAYRVFKVAL